MLNNIAAHAILIKYVSEKSANEIIEQMQAKGILPKTDKDN